MSTILHDTKKHCFYCEIKFDAAHYGTNQDRARTRDHIIPRSKGGINHACNMVYACSPCNRIKASQTLESFYQSIKNRYSKEKSETILKNIRLLIEYRDFQDKKLFKKHIVKDSIVIKPVYPTLRQLNRLHLQPKQTDEKISFLQKQTIEQFKELKAINELVARKLAEPQCNFHYI